MTGYLIFGTLMIPVLLAVLFIALAVKEEWDLWMEERARRYVNGNMMPSASYTGNGQPRPGYKHKFDLMRELRHQAEGESTPNNADNCHHCQSPGPYPEHPNICWACLMESNELRRMDK